ncbi:MAG: ATP-binding protein [Anaerolineaceae bacterium]|nr:MAG: ATP-binding protein [Anaerolineaceae bacterium]
MLSSYSLTIGYHQPIASGLDLQLRPAEMVCLIGPNGAGKSTLLRTLAGMQSPLSGVIKLGEADLHSLPALDLAKQLAVVLTGRVEAGNLSAYALVTLGRHPYTDWRGRLTPHDEEAVRHAMRLTGSDVLASRPIHELSDGERQRVMIARALAQEPSVLLLDEPTAFLDLPRRVELLQLLKRLSRETNCAILLSTHDLDLALRIADRLWLLSSHGELHIGLPEELALNGSLASIFHSEGIEFDHASGAFKVHQPVCGPISLHGEKDGVATAWTWRALERIGYEVHNNGARHPVHVAVLDANHWHLTTPKGQSEHITLQSLIEALSPEQHEN